MLRKANWDKASQKSIKFSDCRKSIRKQIRPSCRKNLSTSFCVCLVSWKQWNLEIRANIPKSCLKPVVSLLSATKSAFTAPNLCWACALVSPVTFLTGDHVMQTRCSGDVMKRLGYKNFNAVSHNRSRPELFENGLQTGGIWKHTGFTFKVPLSPK